MIATLLRGVLDLFRSWPVRLADWADRTVAARHRPVMAPTDDLASWPGGVEPVCVECERSWPCARHGDAVERMERRNR